MFSPMYNFAHKDLYNYYFELPVNTRTGTVVSFGFLRNRNIEVFKKEMPIRNSSVLEVIMTCYLQGHKNIVKVLDFYRTTNTVALILESLEFNMVSSSLRQLVQYFDDVLEVYL